jgi:adenine-specific DNA-methyltransferase
MEKITPGHPLTQSPDFVKENIETLKQLFPTIVKEGKIDQEELQALLGNEVETGDEYYRFTWAGKSMARKEANKPSTGTLRPNKADSKDWDTTQNIFIEGDNLEVLKLLQKSYTNRIKMIYIDPPYNTGKDFVYKDNYADNLSNYLAVTGQLDEEGKRKSTNTESDGRYHSNWLNMMYPRLKLARNLLTEDGVIFISIDDNEVDNLRKVCNEVLGDDNFLGMFIVNSTPNARDYGHIGKMHEFILMYAKNGLNAFTNEIEEEEKVFKYTDGIGGFNIHPLYNSNEAFNKSNRPNLYYPFYLNPQKDESKTFFEISLNKNAGWIEIHPPLSNRNGIQFVWRWGKEKSGENLNQEIVGYRTEEGEYRIVQKMRHSSKLIRSLLLEKSYSSRRGTSEVEEIFKGKIFSFPKPIELIKILIKAGSLNNSLVLDFFAGSGTTAHAVMQLNAEDGGNRKFICVQLPEPSNEDSEAFKAGYKTIAEITKERIRRAGKTIVDGKLSMLNELKKKAEGKIPLPDEQAAIDNLQISISQLDTGFRAFKLDTSNIKAWDGNPDKLEENLFNTESNIKENRTEEDVLYEILLKYGLDLAQPMEQKVLAGKTVFNIGAGALFICLADGVTTEVAEEIGKWKKELEPATCKVIFKDTGFTDVEKTNSMQILKRYGIEEVNSI